MTGWQALLEAMPDAVVVSDGERIVFANGRLHALTGHPPGSLDGAPLELLIPEEARATHRGAVAAYHAAPATRPMGLGRPTVCRHADGSTVPVDISLSPLPMHGWIVAVVRDDRDRLRSEAELFHRATHDPLTGLANRAMLDDRLALAVERHRRQPRPDRRLVVLFVDLDRFKAVNDAHGHAAGDEVLVAVAAALRSTFRPGDTVARVGGDEFVVVCEEMPVGEIAALADRVVQTVAAAAQGTRWPEAQQVTVSVGVASIAEDGESHDLQERADQAMYVAKRAGGNRWSGPDGEDRQAEGREAASEVGGGHGAGGRVVDVDLEEPVGRGIATELGDGDVVVVERLEEQRDRRPGHAHGPTMVDDAVDDDAVGRAADLHQADAGGLGTPLVVLGSVRVLPEAVGEDQHEQSHAAEERQAQHQPGAHRAGPRGVDDSVGRGHGPTIDRHGPGGQGRWSRIARTFDSPAL